MGSFLNVVIHRLPIMLERDWRRECAELNGNATDKEDAAPFNLVVPRSRCPSCKAPIHAWQNIPVLSYLWMRGRCASCNTRISLRYPMVELLTAILTVAVVWRFGFGWPAAGAVILTWCLIALTVIDLDHQLLPDSITLPLMWLGILFSLNLVASQAWAVPVDLRSSVIGAVAGYLSLWSVYWLFKLITGKEGMGYGDFKLFAALGAWMGWQMLPLIILLSAFTGAIVGIGLIVFRKHGRETPIPFGPYLAAAGWIALMWGPQLVDRYLHIARLSPP